MKRILPACALLITFAPAFAQDATTRPSRPYRDPHEIRNGDALGARPQQRKRLFYEHIISRIEPSMHGDVNHLPQYLDFFGHEFVEDPRTFACALSFDVTGDDQAVIKGYLEFAEQKTSLTEFFQHLNLPGVTDSTELLPSADLGRGKVDHAALYLGDNQYLHATEPAVTISSFNPKDPNYDEKWDKSFCFGKRVIE